MSATAAPYGLVPVSKVGGNPNQGGAQRAYPVKATNAALAVGMVAILAAGEIDAAGGVLSAGTVAGVITGIEYTDPVMKYALQDSYLPASAAASGYTNIRVFVNDDPSQLYKVQHDNSVTRADVGKKVDLATNTANAAVKRANTATTNLSTGVGMVVVDFFNTPTSKPADAKTDIIVKFAPTMMI